MSFRKQSQKQKQIEYLQQQLEEHQKAIESFMDKIVNVEGRDLEKNRQEFVDLLTRPISCVISEQEILAENDERPESFLYYIVTLYLYSDDDLYNWFSLLKMESCDQASEEPSFMKKRLLQSMDTGEGKSFKLEGMIALSIVGHRNLLHFLADFSYYKTLFYLMIRMKIDETIDDAGLFPHDLIKVTGFQQVLSTLLEEFKEVEERNAVNLFMEQMLSLKKDNKEIRDIVHRYNQQRREKEKERFEQLHSTPMSVDIESSNIPKDIQLVDACVQSGQCPYQMNYLPPLHRKPIAPSPLSAPCHHPYVEVIVPNKIVLIHWYFSPDQCEAWMKDIQKVYEEGKYDPPNSLNRQGFKTKNTSLNLQVHSLVYFIAKEHGSSLGYERTKTNYDSYHSFVITYDQSNVKDGSASLPKHVDSSLWTANLCLDAVEAENSVKFWMQTDISEQECLKVEKEKDSEEGEDKHDFALKLQTGDLLLHHGDIYHETSGPLKTENGHRTNIVIWYKEAVKI